MSETIKTGTIGTGALLTTNVKPDIDKFLKLLEPYNRPLLNFLLLSKRKSKPVYSQYAKFEWFEKHFMPRSTTVSAAIALTGITLVLTSSNVAQKEIFGLYDIVIIEETSEMAYVSSVIAGGGSDVVLTHMDGTTTLTALTSTSNNIRIIGKRVFEYAGRTDYKTTQEVNVYNYLNEFREFVSTSGRAEAGEAYTDGLSHDERVEQRIKELQLQIETYFFFANARGYATSGNTRTTWGYGLDGYLTTNVKSYSGALTEPAWRNYLKPVMKSGSKSGSANNKIHFANSDQMDEIETIMKDYYQLIQTPKDISLFNEFGASVKTYRMYSGTVSLVWDPVLDDMTNAGGYTLDEANITLRHMAPDKKGSRKFRVRTNTQNNDVDGTETEILFDLGLQCEHETTHGKLYKV